MSASTIAVSLVAGGLSYGTPVLFAGLGELLSERGGVLNLGVEGMMLVGAACGFWVALIMPGPAWLVLTVAVVTAAFAGACMAALFAVMCLLWRADQIVTGLALTIFGGAAGLSSYVASVGSLVGVPGRDFFHPVSVPGFDRIPFFGESVFSGQPILVYLSWLAVVAVSIYLYHTRWGLKLRSVGEDPAAADAMGVNVRAYRFAHVVLGGAFAGVGGATYTLALLPSWSNGLTAGVGFVAIGLVIVAFWRPELLLVGCYVFGVVLSLGFTLAAVGISLPPEFYASLPYLATVVVLVVASSIWRGRRLGAPMGLGRYYSREE
jgi:simple sugar transport system permease protein